MKKIVMIFCAMFIALGMNAQYVGHRFFDNWSVGVEGGVQTNLHDWNAPQGAVAGLHLDKQVTPVFGLTFESLVGFNNLANWSHPEQAHVCDKTVVDAVSAFALGRVNLMNWFCGYNGYPRLFEVEALAGVGYGHTFGTDRDDNSSLNANDFLVKAGANFNFNLGEKSAWTVNVTPAVVWGVCPTQHFNGLDCRHAVAELTAGVTYHFKTSNGLHHLTKAQLYDAREVDALNAEINKLRGEVEELSKRPAVVEKIVEVPVQVAAVTNVISFAQNSAALSDDAVAALKALVANGAKKVAIDAYASPEGSENYNLTLSQQRACAVEKYLIDNGVEVVSASGHGATGAESNRIAIVTTK